jgi:hypothetical protein
MELHDILSLLLRRNRSLQKQTEQFRSMKHNPDLCPLFHRQLERVAASYGKYTPITYDTQGFNDDGSDLIIRYERRQGSEPELIGLQIKSYGDCQKATLMKDLKSQRDDSLRKVLGLKEYFICLCTDEIKHKDLIRRIEAEFRSADRTKVIEPTFLHNFLYLSERQIAAFVTQALQSDDFVYRKAVEVLTDLPSRSGAVVAVFLAVRYLGGSYSFPIRELTQDAVLLDCYGFFSEELKKQALLSQEHQNDRDEPTNGAENDESVEDDESDEDWDQGDWLEDLDLESTDLLARDLELAEGRIANRQGDEIISDIHSLLPLVTFGADAQVRYGIPEKELFKYLLETLGIVGE